MEIETKGNAVTLSTQVKQAIAQTKKKSRINKNMESKSIQV